MYLRTKVMLVGSDENRQHIVEALKNKVLVAHEYEEPESAVAKLASCPQWPDVCIIAVRRRQKIEQFLRRVSEFREGPERANMRTIVLVGVPMPRLPEQIHDSQCRIAQAAAEADADACLWWSIMPQQIDGLIRTVQRRHGDDQCVYIRP